MLNSNITKIVALSLTILSVGPVKAGSTPVITQHITQPPAIQSTPVPLTSHDFTGTDIPTPEIVSLPKDSLGQPRFRVSFPGTDLSNPDDKADILNALTETIVEHYIK